MASIAAIALCYLDLGQQDCRFSKQHHANDPKRDAMLAGSRPMVKDRISKFTGSSKELSFLGTGKILSVVKNML